MPNVEQENLGPKVLTHPCRNLGSGHLVNRFNPDDASTKPLASEAFFEFALGLARAKNQDGLCVTNMRDDLVIVSVEVSRELSVLLVVCRAICRSIATRESHMLFHA